METFKSDISNRNFPVSEWVSGNTVRKSIFELIQKDHPHFTVDNYLSINELNFYREKYVAQFLSGQIGQLTSYEEIVWLSNKGFDPYPFILLNLILSSLAAIQAPVIMMSQNRQETKDRERAQKDYMVNLKSELEIRMLHEKIDHMVLNQQQEIMELHKKQTSMIRDMMKQISNK